MSQEPFKNFKILLDDQYVWPSDYLFKFIVGKEAVKQVSRLFEGNRSVVFKESAKGNYVSLSITLQVESSEAVLVIYEKAAQIPGLIAL